MNERRKCILVLGGKFECKGIEKEEEDDEMLLQLRDERGRCIFIFIFITLVGVDDEEIEFMFFISTNILFSPEIKPNGTGLLFKTPLLEFLVQLYYNLFLTFFFYSCSLNSKALKNTSTTRN